jgi:hypothetical protein
MPNKALAKALGQNDTSKVIEIRSLKNSSTQVFCLKY